MPALLHQYPKHNLSSRSLKTALVDLLVRPHVFALGHRVLAFRVLWRVPDDDLAAAWRGIVGSRRRSDDIIRRTGLASGNVSFFVSAVTGVFTKGKGSIKYGEGPRTVYPAISYWVVIGGESESDDTVTEQELFHQLSHANPTAIIKYIVTAQTEMPRTAPLSLDALAAPLFVTLKDHKNEFTQRKVQMSAQHLCLTDTAIAKLVVVGSVCGHQLHEVCADLCAQKLLIHIDVPPPDCNLSSSDHSRAPSVPVDWLPPEAALHVSESTDD
ncbi:hypothetical protein NP493_730g01023 [Ridgeia piscesae]|uniref:Uncharacterized protein n=1 Tax=Ridgeia piscesae TaxID=27915 RepID=A0AAD9KQ62_RIDPI|nr:hypothetical protein NP493_730g01023 [Ridgeia piscesae]